MTSTTTPSIATIKTLTANPAGLRDLSIEELKAIAEFVNDVHNEKHSSLYYSQTEPLRLAAQAAGFPNGWTETPEWKAAAAAGSAALEADADLAVVNNQEFRNALNRELRRQTTNAARIANTAKRAAAAVASGTYTVGEAVQVHAFGHWYNGEVVKLGRTGKVTVKYTSGTGVTREKAVDSGKVRKAV